MISNGPYMEKYILKMKKNGYKLTSARLGIMRSLLKVKRPLTVRKIHRLLNDQTINLSSVYRNLIIFKRIGIVFEEEFSKESYYYIADEHHHHIYCETCGYIECVPCRYHEIKSPAFSLIDHNIALKGRCKKCASAKRT